MTAPRSSSRWLQAGLITVAAAAVLAGLHVASGEKGLTPMDFVPGGAAAALQFCDPANPQFLPVVARSSPATLSVTADSPVSGLPVRAAMALQTITGKPIGPEDLSLTAGRKLHLFIIDPSLEDFQAVPPEAGMRRGQWTFLFTPHRHGLYRIFADFTPVALEREMYLSADLAVRPGRSAEEGPARPLSLRAEVDGYRLRLQPSAQPIYARQPVELVLTVTRADGGPVPLERGAWAHLMAFDGKRAGFVRLQSLGSAGGISPRFSFTVSIPDPGRYVIWSLLRLGGKELDTPFQIEVAP